MRSNEKVICPIQPSKDQNSLPPKTLTAAVSSLDDLEKDNKLQTGVKKERIEAIFNNEQFGKEKFIGAITDREVPLILVFVKKALETQTKEVSRPALVLLSVSLFWPCHTVRRPALELIHGVLRRLYKLKNPSSENVYATNQPGCERGLFDLFAVALLFGPSCQIQRSIWVTWIKKHEEYTSFLKSEEHCEKIVEHVFASNALIRSNAIQMLISLGDLGHNISEVIWKNCVSLLHSIEIPTCIDVDEKNVQIFNTVEGVLVNTEVIEKNSDANLDIRNMKRESKTYSYKEQMAELQLRKELAEKNRKAGILTDKQKKAVEVELKVEQVIREELRQLYDSVQQKMDILSVAARYNPKGAFLNISLLFDVVVPLLKSKLVSHASVSAFLAFRDAFYEPTKDCLHELVAHSQLRLLESVFLHKNWCDEPLKDQLNRAFLLLSSTCFMFSSMLDHTEDITDIDDLDDDGLLSEGITASKLGFLVPLIYSIFHKTGDPAIDTSLKIRVAGFMKDSINSTFIMEDEVASYPILRLNTTLLDSILLPGSFDYMTDLVTALENYCKLLNTCSNTSQAVVDFIMKIVSHFHENDSVLRRIMIKLLQFMPQLLQEIFAINQPLKDELKRAVFLARHDQDSDCNKLADVVWFELRLKTANEFAFSFMENLSSPKELVREEAASCIRDLVEEFPKKASEVLKSLSALYTKLNELKPAEFDRIGRKLRDEVDDWEKRSGVAKTLLLLAEILEDAHMMSLIKIVVPQGLNDRNEICRTLMRNAAVRTIINHGKNHVEDLLPFLEERLDSLAGEVGEHDNLHTGLIILIGTLARHLENNDGKIRKIVARLIEALSTPVNRCKSRCPAVCQHWCHR
uniref:Uncharacterized protein n=1 Tax=Ditylenchus dipsaci TaxID=166011 RepID=A0A915EVC0_9BILA